MKIFTIYIGDPQSVSAITPPSRNLAKPKSATKNMQQKITDFHRQLPRKSAYVNDSCFITRMLHSNSY